MAPSTVVREVCTCGLDVRDEIWLCDRCHTYRKGKTEFTSVSKVIRTLLPADYSSVPQAVLETARLRGVFVDCYVSEWLTGSPMMEPREIKDVITAEFPNDGEKYAEDTITRICRVIDWWNASGFKVRDVQKTVHSATDLVAGTFDLATDELIIDMKCTAELQPNYQLQVGAYCAYDVLARSPAVLHVTKDKVKLVKYSAETLEDWAFCIGWYRTMRKLNAK